MSIVQVYVIVEIIHSGSFHHSIVVQSTGHKFCPSGQYSTSLAKMLACSDLEQSLQKIKSHK